jgi:hypothetical protein
MIELRAARGSEVTASVPCYDSIEVEQDFTVAFEGSRTFRVSAESGRVTSDATAFPFVVRFRPKTAGRSEGRLTITLGFGKMMSFDMIGIAE